MDDDSYFAEEVRTIAGFFDNSRTLEHERATRDAVIGLLPQYQVVHFSCHGRALLKEPTKSYLLMANREELTVEDIFQLNLKGARLATLSACEAGAVGANLPDEVVSLPAAFMRAGFAGVIAPLWEVFDGDTAKIMEDFYQLWIDEGFTPAKALRTAQRRLRDSEDFETHIDWAAFYLTGV